MKFWRKFWLFVFTIVGFVLLQLFVNEIGRFEFSICEREFSVGIYVICISILAFWLICFSIKSFFIWFLSLFFKNKTAEEIKSINEIARLIVSSDYDFSNSFEKSNVIDSIKILKIALALKRGLCLEKNFDKTGIHCVDIYIIKLELKKFIKNGDLNSAINLANKIIKNYAEALNVVRDEILDVAKLAFKNNISFNFDPKKFKYDLPQSYIDIYFSSLEFVNFEMENDLERKLKILEKLHKNYPANVDILIKFLDFIFENTSVKYDEKKILHIIQSTISVNPDRRISKYLLKLNKSGMFEELQSMTAPVFDNNKEKFWMLLIIATEMKFISRAKELIRKLVEIDKTEDIYKFYIENLETLSMDSEIVSIIQKREIDK